VEEARTMQPVEETTSTRTACRGIRGAITVDGDSTVESATVELMEAIRARNAVRTEDVAAVVFTLTQDLRGGNPAAAARANGWDAVPLLNVSEHPAADADLKRCLRVLVLWNTDRLQSDVRHVYLRGARSLRPDLVRAGRGE
jgi:monofunctional chorismate mutase